MSTSACGNGGSGSGTLLILQRSFDLECGARTGCFANDTTYARRLRQLSAPGQQQQSTAPEPLQQPDPAPKPYRPHASRGTAPPSAPVAAPPLVVSSNPLHVLPSFWSAAKADVARAQALDLMSSMCQETGEGGDNRTMGADSFAQARLEAYSLLLAFKNDDYLRATAATHLGVPHVRSLLLCGSVGIGQASGGSWHKDALTKGFKAMMYLDDVGATNGPFAMLLNYSDADLHYDRSDNRRRPTRFTDTHIAKHTSRGAVVHEVPLPLLNPLATRRTRRRSLRRRFALPRICRESRFASF